MNLGQMLAHARLQLQDLKVSRVTEMQLLRAVNEGKDELAKIIRQARSDFFTATASGTITAAAAPNASSISLPSDFSELKEIVLTESGYEAVNFRHMDRSDVRFKDALVAGAYSGNQGYYYDIQGLSTMIFAPGFDANRPYSLTYIKSLPDMAKRSDAHGLPLEHESFIITWAVTDTLASLADPRFPMYQAKLEYQRNSIINSINTTDLREPKFVQGFLEQWEGW